MDSFLKGVFEFLQGLTTMNWSGITTFVAVLAVLFAMLVLLKRKN